MDCRPDAQQSDQASKKVSTSTFWNAIYEEQESPRWNIGVPPSLVHWLENSGAKTGRVLVPGCGYGHDARVLARHGFDVVAVDFAPLAIRRAHELGNDVPGRIDWRCMDIFDLPKTDSESFDYFFEYTCFVAIEPVRRPAYVELANSLLRPGGMLFGCFYNHGREGGPPFNVTREEVLRLYRPRFEIRKLGLTPHSIERRKGHELWAEFIKADT